MNRFALRLPIARAGVVNFGEGVLIPDAQSSQQRQPRNQHSTTKPDYRQFAVLDCAGHRAYVDAEDRGRLGDRHHGDPPVVQLAGELAEQSGPVAAVGTIGTCTATRRSTTSTPDRPEVAALACSHARCRQVAEHHFGIGPRLRGVMRPPRVLAELAKGRMQIKKLGLTCDPGVSCRPRASSGTRSPEFRANNVSGCRSTTTAAT
jgi:hypothetical protein